MSKNFISLKKNQIITSIVVISCITCLITELSLVNTGLDLSDEGWSFSRFRFPQEVKATLQRDHLYTGMIFQLLNYDPGSLRFVNLTLLISCCSVLGYGTHKYIKNVIFPDSTVSTKPLIIICSIILFQMPSLWIERMPAYNSIASFCNLTIIGFLLLASSGKNFKSLPFLIGILLCLSAIVKPPSGILMTFFIIIFTIVNIRSFKFVLSLFIGVIFFALIHFTFIESPTVFVHTTKNGFLHYSYFDLTGQLIIDRYIQGLLGNILFSILANKYELLLIIVLSLILLNNKNYKITYLFLVFLVIYITYKHYLIGDLQGAMGLYWSLWRLYIAQFVTILAFTISILIYKQMNLKALFYNKISITSFGIITSPIIFAFGTNNLITFNMNFYTSLFFIGILFLLLSFIKQVKVNLSSYHISFFLTLASISPTYAYLHGRLLRDSYTLSEPSVGNIFKNSEIINVHGTNLKVTDSISHITHSLRYELKGYNNKSNYLLNLSNMYGLNFLCDLPHPIQPWTGNMRNNFTLEHIDFDIFQSSAILFRTNDKRVSEQLSKSFPDWKMTHTTLKIIPYKINGVELSLTLLLPNNE